MARKPSPETEIKNLRRQLRESEAAASELLVQRNRYVARVERAEREVSEWKQRFDLLLARTPEVERG